MTQETLLEIKKTQRNRSLKKYLFVVSILIIPFISFSVFYVYLNTSSFVLAFQKVDILGRYSLADYWGFGNFVKIIQGYTDSSSSVQILLCLKNSFKMWWINFLISNPLYLIFSYYICKKFAGHKIFKILVMLPSIVSGFIYAMVYKKFIDFALPGIMNSWGFEKFPNLINDDRYAYGNGIFYTIWLSFGTSILVYTNAMNNVGDEIIESAQLDGCNNTQEFFQIVFPIMWPTLATMITTGVASMFTVSGPLMAFYMTSAPPHIWGFGYYMQVMVKNGAGNSNTAANYTSYPMVAASGLLVSVVTLPIVFFTKWLTGKFDRTEDFA